MIGLEKLYLFMYFFNWDIILETKLKLEMGDTSLNWSGLF